MLKVKSPGTLAILGCLVRTASPQADQMSFDAASMASGIACVWRSSLCKLRFGGWFSCLCNFISSRRISSGTFRYWLRRISSSGETLLPVSSSFSSPSGGASS